MATATGASTRCSRPDCTALREELELVRGDLLELEGENEQLHERVAALEGERSDQSARHAQETAEKGAEARRLSALVQDLSEQLRAAAAAASGASSAPDAALPSDPELQRACDELRDKNRALETQLAGLRASLATETAASAVATEQAVRVAQESQEKCGELVKALTENEQLRGELSALRISLRAASDKAAAYETSVRGMHAQLGDYRSAVDEQTLEITQLHAKLALAEREKRALEATLVEMDEKESDVEALTQHARAAFELEKSAMQRELTQLRADVTRLEEQLARQPRDAKDSGEQAIQRAPTGRARSASLDTDARDAREMAKQLELLQELRVRDKSTILELNQRVLQQQSDLASLAEHVEAVSSAGAEQAVRAAVAKEAAGHAATRAENGKLLRRLQEQNALVRDLEARQGELERQLTDAQAWNERYERGAGLEDVVKFQKQLRRQLEAQQQANAKLRLELNEQIEAAGRLHASFERLKEETGRPSAFQYDDLAVAEHLQGQVAVHRAVMVQMEQQVQELEAERVRLLQRLRDQARVAGGQLYEAHGLTMEQWEIVEEFMDQLKRTPEVAKRVLSAGVPPSERQDIGSNAHGSAPASRRRSVESPSSGESADGWELVVTGDAENARLVDQVARLREELDTAKAQAASNRSACDPPPEGDQPVERDAEVTTLRTTVRELQVRCDGLLEDLDATKRALDAKKHSSAAASTPSDSKSTLDPTLLDGDAEENREERGASSRGTQTADAVASASSGGDNQHDEKSAGGARSPPLTSRGCENSAESIAQTVVKALEAQLALLKQAATPHSAQPTPTATAAVATDTDTSTPATPDATSGRVCPPQEDAASDPMTVASDDELAKQMDYLKELNVCLDELARSEAREEELEAQLREHEATLEALADQHTLLYAHLFHMHAQYSAAEAKLRREREQLEATGREWEVKCQRLEAGLRAVGGADPLDAAQLPTEAQLRAQVAHLTRQMAALEVRDARWKRSSRLMQDELRASASQNAMLAGEWLEMERALKLRILYLEDWKQGADERLERMDKALGASVLKRVADRQQRALVDALSRYRDVSRAYADVRVRYLALYDVPMQLSSAQHRLELLEAERRARTSSGDGGEAKKKKKEEEGGGGGGSTSRGLALDPVLQARIAELELELQAQVARVKELESERARGFQELDANESHDGGWQRELVLAALGGGGAAADDGGEAAALGAENALLYERVGEVEQLYEALTRECARQREVAALAAAQANVLSTKVRQAQREREDDASRRRQLAAASEDAALVGSLQLELVQLHAACQQLALKHDVVVESQQRALLERQQLELAAERGAKELADERDASRLRLRRLEATLAQVGTRDLAARNAKWDAFRTRLDALEGDLHAEHARRKQLELELERSAQQPPTRGNGSGGATVAMAEVSRLRSRVEELETRERALMAQLQAAAASASASAARSPAREQLLADELQSARVLSEDLLRQVQAEQARVAELLAQVGSLEREARELRAQKEDAELELRQRAQQLSPRGEDNQRESAASPVLMRRKVGLYEADQAQLQAAAQATVASLKQLVEDKNALVREYQAKLAAVRAEAAQAKAQERADAAKLHAQLFADNQRVIAQLQEATATIRALERSGKGPRALQAAQERHDQVLRSWKQAELALQEARQALGERQSALERVTNERDLAEARAGEALEEMVALRSREEERARQVEQLEQRVGAARGELSKRDDKLQLLRAAVVKLKEEFLKAEDRHAVELARAQHALVQTDRGRRKQRTQEDEDEQEDEKEDEKRRLEAQVAMLQDKLAVERSKAASRRPTKPRGGRREGERAEAEAEAAARGKEVEALAREVARLQATVKEQAASEARAVERLEKKLKVAQAQNAALREAAVSPVEASTPAGEGDAEALALREEADAATERARKLQRRVEALTARLKEQQEDGAAKDEELAAARRRVEQQQQQLELQRRAQRELLHKPSADKWRAQAADLQRQNALLQETLVLKRSEWEDALRAQLERYEAQVTRLRQRLSRRYGRFGSDSGSDGEEGGRTPLQREEARFLASQELRDELAALGEELRAREQQDMAKDTKLLALELELETLRVETQRLRRRSSASNAAASTGGTDTKTSSSQQEASQASVPRGRSAPTRSDLHERAALETVVENMKQVIEKLRSENDRLRRAHAAASGAKEATPEQLERLRRQLREHKDARTRLEAQLERLERELSDAKKHKLRLQHKLRAAAASMDKQRQDEDAQRRATERALADAKAAIARRDEELQRLRQDAEQLQLDARSPGSTAARGEASSSPLARVEELEEQVAALEDENARLTSELAAFDGEFFEEIEDLKYKYAEAVRSKRALERRLALAPGRDQEVETRAN